MQREASNTSPWIISKRDDLLWFHGSALAGVALLVFFLGAPPSLALLGLLLWGILFDGTHVMGTYARTYLAPDDASKARLPGPWSWLLLAVGPAVALLGHGRFSWFLLAAYLWAYWHLVRQHYGFLALYRRKTPASDIEARLETALLWAGCLYPYLRFSLSPAYAASGLPVLAPAWAAPWMVDVAFLPLLVGLAAALLLQLKRPGPRHLLIAIVIAFHVLVFALLKDLLAITATLTIFHNLQYHRIVWQYERGKGRAPAGSVLKYVALGLALGVAWYGPRVLGAAFAPTPLLRDVLLGLGWGVAFHHYLVDGRIWKLRRTPAVAQTLDAAIAGAPS